MSNNFSINFDGLILDKELNIVHCGRFVQRVLNFNPEDFMGTSIIDFVPKAEKTATKRIVKSILKSKKEYSDLLCGLRNKNGVEFYIQLEFLPYLEDKNIEGVLVKLVDANNYKRIEDTLLQVEERYKIFFENGSDAVFIYQISNSGIPGKFIDFNSILSEYTGLSSDKLFQSSIIDIINRDNYDILVTKLEGLIKKGKIRFESEIKHLNGTSTPVEINSTLVEYNNQKTILNVARNIRKRREVEEKIKTNYEILKTTFEETVRALSAVTEKRDPYTAGHQKRVSNLSVLIGKEMGLSADRIKGIKVAGILHDIGKVSIPSEILTKPGMLTDLEFELMKTHAEVGHDILKKIPFPWSVDKIVHQHHERLDGTGYPNGLLDKGIIIEAKILAVADTVEAMSSHRPYREALGVNVALQEIKANSGIKYDVEVVKACLKVFEDKKIDFKTFELT